MKADKETKKKKKIMIYQVASSTLRQRQRDTARAGEETARVRQKLMF